MEAELQERVESSQKQASHVMEIYESLKKTVDQLKAELDSGTGEMNHGEVLVEEDWKKNYSGGSSSLLTCLHPCFSFQRALYGRQLPN